MHFYRGLHDQAFCQKCNGGVFGCDTDMNHHSAKLNRFNMDREGFNCVVIVRIKRLTECR